MADRDFEFLFVPNRYEDVVQRTSVLYPLTTKCHSTNQIRFQTARLLAMWRARVGALSAYDWRPSSGPHSLTFTRNCCPTFVYARPRTRTCNRRPCPFCYARGVRELWEIVDKQFIRRKQPSADNLAFDDVLHEDDLTIDDVDQVTLSPYDLVERIHRFNWPYLSAKAAEEGLTRQAALRRILHATANLRADVVGKVSPLGAYLATTIEPTPRGWRITYRQLFKISAADAFPEEIEKATAGRFTRHVNPTRKTILGALTRVMRYPIRLIRGDAEMTAELLTIMQEERVRMDAVYGSFRGRRS